MHTLYLIDVYTEHATRDQHSDVPLGLMSFLTQCSKLDNTSLLTSIFSSILKIITLKGVRALRGYFWPPLEPKTESCISPISSYWFVRRIAQV